MTYGPFGNLWPLNVGATKAVGNHFTPHSKPSFKDEEAENKKEEGPDLSDDRVYLTSSPRLFEAGKREELSSFHGQ